MNSIKKDAKARKISLDFSRLFDILLYLELGHFCIA